MKKIVTHINPDLDAVAAVWLLKRFLPDWQGAEIDFAQAESTTEKQIGKDTSDILYVDIGRGKLDHHQSAEYSSATKLTWGYIQSIREGGPLSELDSQAIERMVGVVNQIDNAIDLTWPEVRDDRFHFYLHNLVEGWRELPLNDADVVEEGFKMLDTILLNLKNKIRAEEELKKATTFQTKWGRGIGLETGNKHFLLLAQSQGFDVVFIKNPQNGGVKIHARPDSKVDLTKVYQKVKKLDPQSDWFLHASKKLLLNQASVAQMKPTKLTLSEIMEVLKK